MIENNNNRNGIRIEYILEIQFIRNSKTGNNERTMLEMPIECSNKFSKFSTREIIQDGSGGGFSRGGGRFCLPKFGGGDET